MNQLAGWMLRLMAAAVCGAMALGVVFAQGGGPAPPDIDANRVSPASSASRGAIPALNQSIGQPPKTPASKRLE